jgi:hypothetical protein
MTLTAIVSLLTGKTDTLTMADLEALSDFAGAILRLITDPQAIAALAQLIRETRYPVACKFGRGRKRYYRSHRDGAAAVVHLRGRNELAR